MKPFCLAVLLLLGIPISTFAVQSMYCPANHAYIRVGMTQQEVTEACGAPMKKESSDRPATRRVAVKQLMYNMAGSPRAFFGVYNIPVGTQSGADVEVDIIDNKVRAIRLNGSTANAVSVCEDGSFSVGDNINKVYNACGEPSLVNETHINQRISGSGAHEVWAYQADPYTKNTTRLTFVNGKLQSIDPQSGE